MLVRRLARPMLASVFITGGLDALRHPNTKVAAADPLAPKLAAMLPVKLPQNTEQLVRIDAAVKIGGGTMLALNRVPRLAAVALIGSMVPTTLAGHPFWEEKDPKARAGHQVHFFKNVSIIGGLLLAAVDTEGKPSVGWRARRTARVVAKAAHVGGDTAATSTKKAVGRAAKSSQNALDSAAKSSQKALDSAAKSSQKALDGAAKSSQKALDSAAKSTAKPRKKALKQAKKAAKNVSKSTAGAREAILDAVPTLN